VKQAAIVRTLRLVQSPAQNWNRIMTLTYIWQTAETAAECTSAARVNGQKWLKFMPGFAAMCALCLIAGVNGAVAKPGHAKLSHAKPIAAMPVTAMPQLRQEHGATQLIVDGKPFLVLGGELNNSSASSAAFMNPIWPKLAAMNINTVLAPAYWEFIEPQEGSFDFRSVDALIDAARKHNTRLVLLWFGTWKNSMSSYVPAWVKRDQQRFPRAMRSDGTSIEILSALGQNNLEADSRAFVALMKHLRAIDGARHTVTMVQPENEVGMIPEARDHSPEANAAFTAPVPAQLTDYLVKHKDTLAPSLRGAWQAHGLKVGASWEDTFGVGLATDELFNAWTQALFTGKVAAAGKAVYPLPMFANAALIRPGWQPGQYVSGGPLPHLFDIWHAAAPSLDLLSPDLYFPNFVEWASKYTRPDNPLFIPETGRVNAAEMSANAFWVFGKLDAMAFSPYAPEYLSDDEQKVLAGSYDVLRQLSPLVLAAQGTGRMVGIRPPTAFDGTQDLSTQKFVLGNYTFDIHFKNPPPISIGQKEEAEMPGSHGGLIVQTGPDEFIVAGTGMIVYFGTSGISDPIGGIESVWEGQFVKGVWVPGRCLNGDETNQGRHLRVPSGQFTLHRVRLYHYR
jgi:beta-galactosidase GanA